MTSSIFGRILTDLLAALPGARGAVLADWEGEAVDQATRVGTTNIRLVGAHWGIIYYLARTSFEKLRLGAPRELQMFLTNEQVVVRCVANDYFVVVSSDANVPIASTLKALDAAERRIIDAM